MLADGHTVVGIDNLIGGERENVSKGVQFYRMDCRDFLGVKANSYKADIVYHCAATAYEGLSVFSPHLISQNIVSASASVFSAAIANKVKRIVFCSSMARYGAGYPPFEEKDGLDPQDPYGIAKLAAEQLLRNLCEIHGIEYVIAVPHNIIGPRQKYDDPYRNVASIMINLMLQGRQPIIYGDGSQRRCFSFVDDVLQCLKLMGTQAGLSGQIINVGPDENPATVLELATRIANLIDFPLNPTFVTGRPQEVKVALCSSAKARKLLGYKTTVDLDTGLARMIEYIRQRGPKPFKYHLPLEIVNERTPKTWTERLF